MKVVAYLRVSTCNYAVQASSLKAQERAIRAHAARRGLTVADVYVEQGSNNAEEYQPALLRLVEDARRPGRAFNVVLVESHSRLKRDQLKFERLRRELQLVGVGVQSVR